jgi:hypothetical protein
MTRRISAEVRGPNKPSRAVGSQRHRPRSPARTHWDAWAQRARRRSAPFDHAKVYALEECPESCPHCEETEWDRGSTGP